MRSSARETTWVHRCLRYPTWCAARWVWRRQEGYDDSDAEGSPDPSADEPRSMKQRWYHKVDVSKFSAGGPGQATMRRAEKRESGGD